MIEQDILTILKADSTLDTLLGSSANDSKIYPLTMVQAGESDTKGRTVPYVVYANSIGSPDEIIDEDAMEFTIVDDSMLVVQNIRNRMKTLLDKQDGIQPVVSSDYWIYYSKLVNGSDGYNLELKYYYTTMVFAIKYKKKS